MAYDIWQNASGGALRPDARNLDPRFLEMLQSIYGGMPEDMRDDLSITSAYRSPERQQQLWDASDKTGKMVARPGSSKHNLGLAVDFGYATPEVKAWMHENAGNYGAQYPMSYEDWHLEPIWARGEGAPTAAYAGLNEGGARRTDPNRPHGYDPMQEKVMRGLMGNEWVDKRPAGLADPSIPDDETPEQAAARARSDKWDRTAGLFGMAAEFLA